MAIHPVTIIANGAVIEVEPICKNAIFGVRWVCRGIYNVTHIPTGCQQPVHFDTKREARAAARISQKLLAGYEFWQQTDAVALIEALPQWWREHEDIRAELRPTWNKDAAPRGGEGE